ncbi:MAG TPA: hypothetical protein VF979_10315 [Streptosporangiaceae bacterium]
MARTDLGDPAALRQLLISRGMRSDADDEAMLAAARSAKHKLHITVLSARESAGQSLSPEQQAELAAYRHRLEQYRAAWSIVADAAPHAQVVKGWTIGDHYPPGLLRSAGDLDVVCPPGELWGAARALIDRGWELEAMTIFPSGPASAPSCSAPSRSAPSDVSDRCHVLMAVTRPSDCDLIEDAYDVELRTADVATSIRVPARALNGNSLSPAAANVLALAAERWERPFRSRDVYDLAILAGQLDRAGLDSLGGALTATMLWPQMRELSRLLRRSGLAAEPAQPGRRREAWRARAARLRRSSALWSNPLRVAGLASISTTDADRGALADRLAHAVQRRIGSWRLLRLGLPLFAVPLTSVPVPVPVPGPGPADSRADVDGLKLERRGPHLIARTPIGSFLLVAGSCPQAWLEEVSGRR